MTERSGGYPLMNLAADAGVDYGDVLLMADGYRYMVRGDQPPYWRMELVLDACARAEAKLGKDETGRLYLAVYDVAKARWERPAIEPPPEELDWIMNGDPDVEPLAFDGLAPR